MTTIELEQEPEMTTLIIALRKGETVDIVDHGKPLGRFQPAPSPARLCAQLKEMHKTFTSPPYPGNSVVDMRRESDR